MSKITAEDVAKHLAEWGDYEYMSEEVKAHSFHDGNVIHFETWRDENHFHAVVLPGKHGGSLTERPTGYGAVVLDNYGDAWQLRGGGHWYCAIDGDEFSFWGWDRLLKEMGPLSLLHPGFNDDQEV